MKERMVFVAAVFFSVTCCFGVFPMGGEHTTGVPMGQQPQWPAGLANLLSQGPRVYGYWVNANDWFLYAGDTEEFNEFIMQYAALKDTPLNLTLHSGQGKTGRLGYGEEKIEFDWQVAVLRRGWHPEAPEDPKRSKPGYVVSVETWLGGKIELSGVKVPLNVNVKSGEKDEKLTRFIAAHEARRENAREAEGGGQPIDREGQTVAPAAAVATPIPSASVSYKSEKPRYAKVALTQDGSKILSVVFDESEGTGKGYDVLYADVNFNGKFEQGEKVNKTVPAGVMSYGLVPPGWSSSTFSPIHLNVPYDEKGEGIPNPCEVIFTYQRYQAFPEGGFITSFGRGSDEFPELSQVVERVGPNRAKAREDAPLTLAAQPQMREEFSVRCLIRLRQDSHTWEYSFEEKIEPSESLESAKIWRLDEKPKLEVTARPDGRRKANAGVGIKLVVGEERFEGKEGGEPLKAHVEIRKPDGEVVHRGDAPVDQFWFG